MTHVPTVIISRTAAALAGLGRRVEVPNKLGSVSLIRPLGEGGMSVVHLGRHDILQTNVAVKFLLDIPASSEDPRFTAFLEGAKAAAAIKHPGLNVIYHADAIEGIPYLVMELIEGPTIADLLRRHGPMPLNIARTVMESVCSAVGELHDHAIIHRDIKPANIMIDPAGRVVVTDFGLAMQRPAALFGGAAGCVAGTPSYMAPEMFEASVSSRTDVYAVGATMFEVLTGRPPFDGDFQELRFAHRTTPPPVAPLAARGVPESIIVLVERALHKDTLFRPKSARHVLDAFVKACEAAAISRATDAQIQRYIEIGHGGTSTGSGVVATPAYYQRLNTLAEVKRRTPEATMAPAPEASAPVMPAVHTEPGPGATDAAPAADAVPATSVGGVEARAARLPAVVPPGVAIPVLAVLGSVCVVAAYHAGVWVGKPVAVALLGATLLFAWWMYLRLSLSRPACNGSTRCGWCGSTLSNLRDMRCTECGRLIGLKRSAGEVPIAHRWTTRAKLYGVAAAVFIALLAVLGPPVVNRLGIDLSEYSLSGFFALAGVIAPILAASLVALHFCARSTACLTGRTYCGKCGADFAGSTKPECPACSHRL